MKLADSWIIEASIKTIRNWPSFLLNWLLAEPVLGYGRFVKKSHMTCDLHEDVRVKVRNRTNTDRAVIIEVYFKRCYTQEGFEISDTDVVLDIGAHIGVFTLLASKAASKGRVYSFEPIPENYELLKENIALNGSSNVVAVKSALSNETGYRDIWLSDANTGGHSFYRQKAGDRTVTVEVVTLEEVMKQHRISHADFMKMDCEGSEYDILTSCSSDTLSRIDKISMEWHYLDEKRNQLTLVSFLQNNGFEVNLVQAPVCMLYARRNRRHPGLA
jgi:FkbM family methyltransferase